MTCYTVELYDKDNDLYEGVATLKDEQTAYEVGQVLGALCHKDMILNRYNGRQEPFDWAEVYKNSMVEGRTIQECLYKF